MFTSQILPITVLMRCTSLFQRPVDAVFGTGAINSTPELRRDGLHEGWLACSLKALRSCLTGALPLPAPSLPSLAAPTCSRTALSGG